MEKHLFSILIILILVTTAQASTVNGFDVNLYGFVKASSTYASEGLASYNNINLSAPTHAVAQTRNQDKTSRMSFQTQQSRIGLNLKKGDQLSSKLEFDFIDFNKSSPTTQMVPRVRIASVTYAWDHQKIIIGQDWDLFSPVTNYTFDYVGLYFMAGNTGFMRQQAQYIRTEGNWEFGAALGMAGNNPAAVDGDLELSKSPTYAARAGRKINNGRIGVSGIYGRLNYEQSNGSTHDSYSVNAFYEQVFEPISVKSEFYCGKNLANLGALSIGRGTDVRDVKEYGGMITAHYKVIDKHFLFGGLGIARVDNKTEITPFGLSAINTISSPGVRENFLSRVGWEYRVTEDFSWISEVSRFDTDSKLAVNKYQRNIVGSLEIGVQLRF